MSAHTLQFDVFGDLPPNQYIVKLLIISFNWTKPLERQGGKLQRAVK